LHAQNHNYERARELARTRAETFSTKIAKIAQKGLLHAKFGVQVLCGKCKRPCKSLAQVQGLLHARAILKCSRPRARFESCTRASVQDKILSAKFSGLHHACTPLARLLHARNPKICSCAGCYCLCWQQCGSATCLCIAAATGRCMALAGEGRAWRRQRGTHHRFL